MLKRIIGTAVIVLATIYIVRQISFLNTLIFGAQATPAGS